VSDVFGVGQAVSGLAQAIGSFLGEIFDQIENLVRYAYRWLRENLRRVIRFVVDGARRFIRYSADVLRRLGHHLLSAVREGARFLTRYIMDVMRYFARNWGSMFRWIVRAGFKEPEYGFAMIVFVREIFMPT